MRFWKTLGVYLGVLGAILIGAAATLFLVFPRVVNQLADVLGTMGEPGGPLILQQGLIHAAIAAVIDLLLLYFFVWRPLKTLRDSGAISGLVVRKGEGRAFIDAESVRQQVYSAVSKIAGIEQADIHINNDEGRAVIQVNLLTDLDLNGPKKKTEINREVRKIVQDQLGVDLGDKPTINFRLVPLSPDMPVIELAPEQRASITAGSAIKPLPSTVETPLEVLHPAAPAVEPPTTHVSAPQPAVEPVAASAAVEPAPEPASAASAPVSAPEPFPEPDDTEILGATENAPAVNFERKRWQAPGDIPETPRTAEDTPVYGMSPEEKPAADQQASESDDQPSA